MATARESLAESTNISAGIDLVHIEGPTLNDELRKLARRVWKTKVYSDLTLDVRGREFRVHRFVLGAHSSYFMDGTQPRVTLDLDPTMVQHVLTFLYNGKLDLPRENMDELRSTADSLGVISLVNQCLYAEVQDRDVTVDNCLQTWMAAHTVGDEALTSQSLDLALNHLDEVQNKAEYTYLPSEFIMGYLAHPELKVQSPDERLGAGLVWIRSDPDVRIADLVPLLDSLPLDDMQRWFLKQLALDPLLKGKPELLAEVQSRVRHASKPQDSTSKSGISADGGQTGQTPLSPPSSNKKPCLIAVGIHKIKDGKLQPASDEVWAMGLYGQHKAQLYSHIGAHTVPSGVPACSTGDELYVGGLGEDRKQLWRVDMSSKTSKQLCNFTTVRVGHAMCSGHQGVIYIIGGIDVAGHCIDSVECYDPQTGKCRLVKGSMKYSNIYNPDGKFNKLSCRSTKDGLIVCGAYRDLTESGDRYQHTIQLFSTTQHRTTHVITLPLETEHSAYHIMEISSDTYILFAGGYTVVFTLSDIKEGRADRCRYLDKYIVPNIWCGVALDRARGCILLYGGVTRQSKSEHFVYKAKISEILQNTGRGWKKVQSEWSLGECVIYGFDTVDIQT